MFDVRASLRPRFVAREMLNCFILTTSQSESCQYLGLQSWALAEYSSHREVNKLSETPPNDKGESPETEKNTQAPDSKETLSPVLARLIEEVRVEKSENPQAYNRMHNRHNRSR